MIVRLTDPDDERLRPYRAVGDPELAARDGVFVAEGREVVRSLLRSRRPYRVRSLLLTAAARVALGSDLETLDPGVPVFEVPAGVTESVTGFNIHRGCLALVDRPPSRDWRRVAGGAARTLIVLEDVANPDNIGAVFRHARALGADGVLINGRCSNPLYRKAIRTSMGAVLDVPFAVVDPWPDALAVLRGLGWEIVALTPNAGHRLEDWRARVAPGTRVALLAGHEGTGLSERARTAADHLVSIPMVPGANSLNVAVAVAIALYELHGRAGT